MLMLDKIKKLIIVLLLVFIAACEGGDCVDGDDFGEYDFDNLEIPSINSGLSQAGLNSCNSSYLAVNKEFKDLVDFDNVDTENENADIPSCTITVSKADKISCNSLSNCSIEGGECLTNGEITFSDGCLAKNDDGTVDENNSATTKQSFLKQAASKCSNECIQSLTESVGSPEPADVTNTTKNELGGISLLNANKDAFADKVIEVDANGEVYLYGSNQSFNSNLLTSKYQKETLGTLQTIITNPSTESADRKDDVFTTSDGFSLSIGGYFCYCPKGTAGCTVSNNCAGYGNVYGEFKNDRYSLEQTNLTKRFNFLRRGMIYLRPHPEGYSFNKGQSTGVPLYPNNKNSWQCYFSDTDIDTKETSLNADSNAFGTVVKSTTSMPDNQKYMCLTSYSGLSTTNTVIANKEYGIESEGKIRERGGLVFNNDSLSKISIDLYNDMTCDFTTVADKKVINKCHKDGKEVSADYFFKEGKNLLLTSRKATKSLTMYHPYKLALRIVSGPSSNGTCVLNVTGDGETHKVTLTTSGSPFQWQTVKNDNNKEVVFNEFSTIDRPIASTVSISADLTDSAKSKWNYDNANTNIDCGEGVEVIVLYIHDIQVKTSGFVNLWTAATNAVAPGSTPELKYTIINPRIDGSSYADKDTARDDNPFYEKCSSSTDYCWFDKGIKAPYITNSSTVEPDSVYLRKGQIIRFDYSNWLSLTDEVTPLIFDQITNPRQIGVGLMMDITPRPAVLCTGVASEKISNPSCNVRTSNGQEVGCLTDKTTSQICGTKEALNSGFFCPLGCLMEENTTYGYYTEDATDCYEQAQSNVSVTPELGDTEQLYGSVSKESCNRCGEIKNFLELENSNDNTIKNVYENLCTSSGGTVSNGVCKPKSGSSLNNRGTMSIDNIENFKTSIYDKFGTGQKETVYSEISLIQCYNLEDYIGRVSDISSSQNTSYAASVADEDTAKLVADYGLLSAENISNGAKKLKSLSKDSSKIFGTLEDVSNLDTYFTSGCMVGEDIITDSSGNTYSKDVSNCGYQYASQGSFVANENSRIQFLFIGNSNFDSFEPDAVIDGKYSIKLSSLNPFTNGKQLEVRLTNTGDSDIMLVKFDTNNDFDPSSPYYFNASGNLVRSRDGSFGLQLSEFSENITDKNKFKDIKLAFKIIDPEEGTDPDRYSNNSGTYTIRMKAEKDMDEESGILSADIRYNPTKTIVKSVLNPILEVLDGKNVAILEHAACQSTNSADCYFSSQEINSPGGECNVRDNVCLVDITENGTNTTKPCEKGDKNCYFELRTGETERRSCNYTNNTCYRSCDSRDPVNESNLRCVYVNDGSGFVYNFYSAMINSSAYQLILKLCMTLMITFYGLGYFFGLTSFKQDELLSRMMRIALIYLFVGKAGNYFFNEYVFKFFKDGIDYLVLSIVGSFDDGTILAKAAATDFKDRSLVFDGVDKNIKLLLGDQMMKKVGALIFSTFLFGWIYWGVAMLSIITYLFAVGNALLLYITAQIFLSILIGFGPIFFVFVLFEKTKGMFDKWVNTLISFSLQQIVLATVLSFFNILIYNLFKFVFGYSVCWAPVWVVKLPLFGSINVFSFYRPMGIRPGASLESVAAQMPGLFHMLFIYMVSKLMVEFIEMSTSLGDELIDGGVNASSFSSGIRSTVSNAIDKGADKLKEAGGKLAQRAGSSLLGIKTDEERKAEKEKSKTMIAEKNRLSNDMNDLESKMKKEGKSNKEINEAKQKLLDDRTEALIQAGKIDKKDAEKFKHGTTNDMKVTDSLLEAGVTRLGTSVSSKLGKTKVAKFFGSNTTGNRSLSEKASHTRSYLKEDEAAFLAEENPERLEEMIKTGEVTTEKEYKKSKKAAREAASAKRTRGQKFVNFMKRSFGSSETEAKVRAEQDTDRAEAYADEGTGVSSNNSDIKVAKRKAEVTEKQRKGFAGFFKRNFTSEGAAKNQELKNKRDGYKEDVERLKQERDNENNGVTTAVDDAAAMFGHDNEEQENENPSTPSSNDSENENSPTPSSSGSENKNSPTPSSDDSNGENK